VILTGVLDRSAHEVMVWEDLEEKACHRAYSAWRVGNCCRRRHEGDGSVMSAMRADAFWWMIFAEENVWVRV
jgi:hypothetical protein